MDIDIRLATTDDLNFIKDSWMKSIIHTYPNLYLCSLAKDQLTNTFQRHMNNIIEKSFIQVAHLKDDMNEIISYIIYQGWQQKQIVHFAYTKSDARHKDIMNKLIKETNPNRFPIIFTCPAKNEHIMKHFANKYTYDPTILSII